jgi:hypothetical protein
MNTQATIESLPLVCNDTINTTIDEAFFPMDPPRSFINSTEQNQNGNGAGPQRSRKKDLAEDLW